MQIFHGVAGSALTPLESVRNHEQQADRPVVNTNIRP